MIFAYRPVKACEGMLLGHSVQAGPLKLRKSHWLTQSDIAALTGAGVAEVFAGAPEAGDVAENDAAKSIADLVRGTHVETEAPHTGRCNLIADCDGLLRYQAGDLIALNLVDDRITLALPLPLSPVRKGDLIGTVKIIPFAVPQEALEDCARTWRTAQSISIAPFNAGRAFLLETTLPSLKPLPAKTLELTRGRVERTGFTLEEPSKALHHPRAVSAWLEQTAKHANAGDVLLIFGASATVDSADVIPQAILDAGGTLKRVGMAADPGNLLVFGMMGPVPVIGLPGCAKSPALNGFDWVLERVGAGLEITKRDWAAFSVGGLLKEIEARPQLRRPRMPKTQP